MAAGGNWPNPGIGLGPSAPHVQPHAPAIGNKRIHYPSARVAPEGEEEAADTALPLDGSFVPEPWPNSQITPHAPAIGSKQISHAVPGGALHERLRGGFRSEDGRRE
jgi:hypothetical protein